MLVLAIELKKKWWLRFSLIINKMYLDKTLYLHKNRSYNKTNNFSTQLIILLGLCQYFSYRYPIKRFHHVSVSGLTLQFKEIVWPPKSCSSDSDTNLCQTIHWWLPVKFVTGVIDSMINWDVYKIFYFLLAVMELTWNWKF